MPLNLLELERANAKCADLQRRLHADAIPDVAELQRNIVSLTEILASTLHVLDRVVGELNRTKR